eukprot:9700750-Lingulodinium_polyedra.AAC.1
MASLAHTTSQHSTRQVGPATRTVRGANRWKKMPALAGLGEMNNKRGSHGSEAIIARAHACVIAGAVLTLRLEIVGLRALGGKANAQQAGGDGRS